VGPRHARGRGEGLEDHRAPRRRLGFSRIVVSEIETPLIIVNLWMSGGTKRQCDRALIRRLDVGELDAGASGVRRPDELLAGPPARPPVMRKRARSVLACIACHPQRFPARNRAGEAQWPNTLVRRRAAPSCSSVTSVGGPGSVSASLRRASKDARGRPVAVQKPH
jgi:hypothetical protein